MVTENALLHPWVVAVAIVVVLGATALGWFLRVGPPAPSRVRWVANASYLTQLSAFRARLAIYKGGLAAALAITAVGALAAGVLVARPVERQIRNEELATRDIVLCLDTSGSMVSYDVEIIEAFLELVESFDGERIALSIWNQTSRTVFPLTDDYGLIIEELTEARTALDVTILPGGYVLDDREYERLMEFIAGTESMAVDGSSLVGDGLASCGLLFDEADTERSRSIILATDNEVIGEPVFTLAEAGAFVAERDIGLIGLYAGAQTAESEAQRKEFEEVVAEHDGLFFVSEDPAAIDAIIDRIQTQQAVDLDANPEVVIIDRPVLAFTWLSIAAGALLLLVWRLRT